MQLSKQETSDWMKELADIIQTLQLVISQHRGPARKNLQKIMIKIEQQHSKLKEGIYR